MISERALLHGMIVAGCYLLLLPFQLVIFPSNYYSVRDVIYSGDIKKAMKASAGRLVMVIAIALVFRAAKFSSRQIVAGVTLGSFLCVWPSIYHYQLFVVHRDRVKLMYFLSCVASVAYSGRALISRAICLSRLCWRASSIICWRTAGSAWPWSCWACAFPARFGAVGTRRAGKPVYGCGHISRRPVHDAPENLV